MFGKNFLMLMVLLIFPLVLSCGGGSGSGDDDNGGNGQPPPQAPADNGIALTADPVEVVRGGPSLITASLGNGVTNKASRPVSFELTINPSGGAIESADRVTDDQGTARAVYRAGNRGGVDVVRVRVPPHGDATVNIKVFDADPPRQSLSIKAEPDEVELEGVSTITATLTDNDGPVRGVSGDFSIIENRSGARLSVTNRLTNVNGQISAHYRAGRRSGIDVIQASFPPRIAATVNITVDSPTARITILPSTLPDAQQHRPYNALLTASGGRPGYRFSLEAGSAMPPGLTLNANGVISGTPTRAGTFRFVIRVVDTAGSWAVEARTLVVTPASRINIQDTLPNAIQFAPYSHLINVTGGNPGYRFTLAGGSLPPGIGLAANGIVSGTPNVTGTYNFVVRVVDSVGDSNTANVRLTVNPPAPLRIVTNNLIDGIVGQQYNDLFEADGGRPPYAWNIPGGSILPPGLTMNARGIVFGTPTQAGTFNFIVRVRDANGTTVDKRISVVIAAP